MLPDSLRSTTAFCKTSYLLCLLRCQLIREELELYSNERIVRLKGIQKHIFSKFYIRWRRELFHHKGLNNTQCNSIRTKNNLPLLSFHRAQCTKGRTKQMKNISNKSNRIKEGRRYFTFFLHYITIDVVRRLDNGRSTPT